MAKKTKPVRIYISSELFQSQELPDFLKEMVEREECYYRVTKRPEQLTKKEKRESHERVTKDIIVNDGTKEVKIPLVSFDRKGKRYYRDFIDLSDMLEFCTDFTDECDLGFSIDYFDPEDPEDEKFLEVNYGLGMAAGYCMEVKDGVVMLEEQLAEMAEMYEEGEEGVE